MSIKIKIFFSRLQDFFLNIHFHKQSKEKRQEIKFFENYFFQIRNFSNVIDKEIIRCYNNILIIFLA